jgi:hypothetical protein
LRAGALRRHTRRPDALRRNHADDHRYRHDHDKQQTVEPAAARMLLFPLHAYFVFTAAHAAGCLPRYAFGSARDSLRLVCHRPTPFAR